jgi:zinc transport system substrate-binding protein
VALRFQKIIGLTGILMIISIIIVVAVVRGQHQQSAEASKVSVVATYYPLYEFTKQVGGNYVQVQNVTPAGAEPHDFEPSPQTLATMQKADVFVYNGAPFEPWVGGFIGGYEHTAVKASTQLSLLAIDGKNGAKDPHFWLDPVDAQTVVNTIRDGLSKADPAHMADYTRNAEAYVHQLQQLDQAYASGLKSCQTRTVVTSHAAFAYLAKRYDLHVMSIAGVSPEDEPTPAKLAEITKLVQAEGIQYIFFEQLVSPRLADTIAHETGARTAVFDPIEGLNETAQKAGENYFTIQRDNIGTLRAALACQ